METLKMLINQHNIRASAEWADSNPNMYDAMPEGSSHWKVTLRGFGRRMTVPFSMGPAHSREPAADDVLECLLSDADGADETFENWCADFGFDPDSRRAEKVYRTVVKQAAKLRKFLGEHYETFLYCDR